MVVMCVHKAYERTRLQKYLSIQGAYVSTEVGREQTYVSMLYGRLDHLRELATERLNSSVQGSGPGGTFQARGERDSAVTMYSDQIAQYNAVENGLCFGRLDYSDGGRRYVGRIGIHV